jgi:hypothetical protein
MEASTLIDRKSSTPATVVPLVAHGPLEHGTFETRENGVAVTRCRLYRNLECGEHQGTHEALKPYQGPGRFRIPFTVWIDPDGKQSFRRDGWRRPEQFLLDMRNALEKVAGPHRTREEFAALVKPLDEARAALSSKRYAEAAAKFEEAARTDVPEVRSAADAGLQEIRTMGDTIVAAAKGALKGGRTRQARPALDMAARNFPSLECGKEALELIRKLPFPLRTLTFSVDDNTAGRRILHVRGDGACFAQIVAPKAEEPVLQERRYEFTLDAGAWEELSKLIETHRFFEIQVPHPAGSATPEHTSLKVELWTGASGSVYKEVGESHADLDPICAWLSARIRTAGEGTPKLEAPFDPAWRPEGFAK